MRRGKGKGKGERSSEVLRSEWMDGWMKSSSIRHISMLDKEQDRYTGLVIHVMDVMG